MVAVDGVTKLSSMIHPSGRCWRKVISTSTPVKDVSGMVVTTVDVEDIDDDDDEDVPVVVSSMFLFLYCNTVVDFGTVGRTSARTSAGGDRNSVIRLLSELVLEDISFLRLGVIADTFSRIFMNVDNLEWQDDEYANAYI